MRYLSFLLILLLASFATPAVHAADGKVEFELYMVKGFQPIDSQRWFELLQELDVGGLQIRQATGRDVPEIVTGGTASRPVYKVKAYLTDRGEMLLPNDKFKLQDRSKLKTWLEELRTWGPQGKPEGKPLFGLNNEQYELVRADLRRKVTFSTKEMTRLDALARIRNELEFPLQLDRQILQAIPAEDKVEQELAGLSAGTSLACLLRPAGLVLRPERLSSGRLQYQLRDGTAEDQPWPVGWDPEVRDSKAAPVLMEFLDVEIEPTPLDQVLPILGERMKLPLVFDRNQMVKHDVDPAKVKVSFPSKRSYYDRILRTVLSQAMLKHEVRVDEAGKPFLWITTMKK